MKQPKNSYKWFTNKDCKYYPCKREPINCMFCYCPCYHMENCPGTPKYLDNGIKDCSKCLFPHDPENYDKIMEILKEKR